MNYEAALIQMDCFVEERAYDFHKEAWAVIRAKLAESTNTSTNKQSTPCSTCSESCKGAPVCKKGSLRFG